MDSSNLKTAAKNPTKIASAKTEQPSTSTTSAHHSATQQAKPFNLKRRKRRIALAGW